MLLTDIVEVGPKSRYLLAVREMVNLYAKGIHVQWKGTSLDFSSYLYDETLPGRYASPHGNLWVGLVGEKAAGCVGLCKVGTEESTPLDGELKRLFVLQEFRGFGFSAQLVRQAVSEAQKIGFERLWIESINPYMSAVYTNHGFKPVTNQEFYDLCSSLYGPSSYRLSYILKPIPGTEYMKLTFG